jgi:DNA-binding phage protein
METKQMYSNINKLHKFSDWLREELESQDLKVTRLAKISGVHQNTIRNYLAERCEPTLFNVQCLVTALGYELAVIPLDSK